VDVTFAGPMNSTTFVNTSALSLAESNRLFENLRRRTLPECNIYLQLGKTLKRMVLHYSNKRLNLIIDSHHWSHLSNWSIATFDIRDTGAVTQHQQTLNLLRLYQTLENSATACQVRKLVIDTKSFKWDLDERTTSVAFPTMLPVTEDLRAVAQDMMCGKMIQVKTSASLIQSSFNQFAVLKGWLRTGRIQSFRNFRYKLDPQVLQLGFNVHSSLMLRSIRVRALDFILATSKANFDVVVQIFPETIGSAQRTKVRKAPELENIQLEFSHLSPTCSSFVQRCRSFLLHTYG
jgi:hypothetical protein